MADVSRGAAYLVSSNVRPITLEIECATRLGDVFAEDYSEWTGQSITWQELTAQPHSVDCGSGKWGREPRVYFPGNDAARNQLCRYGFNVESGDVRHPGTYRVNSIDLFRALVQDHGFRLGPNP